MKTTLLRYLLATLLLSCANYATFAQVSILIEGERYYCNSEPVTIELIDAWKLKDKAIELDVQNGHYQDRVNLLELQIEQLEIQVAAKDEVIETVDEVVELTEEQVKRLKRQKVSAWFKSTGIAIAAGLAGVGVGIGIGVYVGK